MNVSLHSEYFFLITQTIPPVVAPPLVCIHVTLEEEPHATVSQDDFKKSIRSGLPLVMLAHPNWLGTVYDAQH